LPCRHSRCRGRRPASQKQARFSGAMEDMSGKVQNANTHRLGSQNHEHAHSSRSVQGPVQWGDGTLHAWVRFCARTHSVLPQHTANSEHTSGAMEEMSGQGQKASTPRLPDSSRRWCWSVSPCPRCRVPHPASQKNERVMFQVQGGDGGNVWEGSKCKHSPTAAPHS